MLSFRLKGPTCSPSHLHNALQQTGSPTVTPVSGRVQKYMLCVQVLIQSFMRADKLKDDTARAEAQAAADSFITAMPAEPEVTLEEVFVARQGALAVQPPFVYE